LRSAFERPSQGEKTNVQTTLCDRREPANASSLYLAIKQSLVPALSVTRKAE
jgi:hypothetical protein